MATVSGGDKLKKAIDSLLKKAGKPVALSVGFLGDATYPDGTGVAEVAIYNEFGRPSVGQPPRPFFRNAIAKNKSKWAPNLATALKMTNNDAKLSLRFLGEEIKAEIVESINEFTSPPLAESTIKAKGFDKPLIDTGLMRDSVDYKVE